MRSRQSQELLDDLVEAAQPNLEIFKLLLRNEDERGVMKFRDLGADLLALTSQDLDEMGLRRPSSEDNA